MTTKKLTTVELETPLKRGKDEITSINLRKPNAGELRGLSLVELLNLKTDEVMKILPRITQPSLVEAELQTLSPADLIQLATEVVSFLVPAKAKEAQEA